MPTSSVLNDSVEMVPCDVLTRHPRNPRVGNLDAIRESIRVNGFWGALVVQKSTNHVLAGNHRLEAARAEGYTQVPVVFVDVNDELALRILLADNRTSDLGVYDNSSLLALLDELSKTPTSLAGLGYNGDDLKDLLAKVQKENAKGWGDRKDSVAEKVQARTQPGDVWTLGPHRLMCGDSTKLEDVKKLMNGQKAVLFHTDPPYLVDYVGSDRPSHGKNWGEVYNEVEIKDGERFFADVFANATHVLEPDAAWYCWHAHKRASLIERVWEALDVINHQQIIWVKPTILHGFAYYPWQHEPCLMGWRKGHKPKHDGKNDASVTSVWHVDWEGKARVVNNEHPTQKPVELFAIPMRKHTQPGELCYEPFSGSGSQLIAAESEGRVCYAMELSPQFCDVAVARWEGLTGKTAGRNV